ncbi:HEPN domain-containing protein [Motiliproteus sp. SC1-56]|uniref:HEPN domain-containing protein n=1 Tax=Motiliproteus sp. SC1-56 TaxID=2799565 RepID=UPI001A8FC5EC|nr:HEPN domain-containing protein [Motiliproteus sp. SC1-56]
MSNAKETFLVSIQDAEELLQYYDQLNAGREGAGRDPEVLKRAALIMTLTAWETYVEDRIEEEMKARLKSLDGSHVAKFIQEKLEKELKFFHNPNSQKTKQLFETYLGTDVTEHWQWLNFDVERSRETLNSWIKKRGEAVHRSVTDKQSSHLVRKNDMKKCIGFFRELVCATDRALEA